MGENNPQLQELKANIAQLRARLAQQKTRVTGSLAVNNTVNQGRLASSREELAQQRNKILQMKSVRDEGNVLKRDVDNAQRVYDADFSRLTQSTLESQATQTNVSVLKLATPPPFPTSPRVMLNVAIACLVALFAALATAVIRERLDWRMRTEADVIGALNQPLLGVLPDKPQGKFLDSKRSLRFIRNRTLRRPTSLPAS